MDRGAWWATVHGVAMSRTRISDQHFSQRSIREMGLPEFAQWIKEAARSAWGLALRGVVEVGGSQPLLPASNSSQLPPIVQPGVNSLHFHRAMEGAANSC